MKKLVAYANSKGVKVHGLGFTGQGVEKYGFYSVDSTSWNTISRFGTLYQFKGDKVVNVSPSNKKINKLKYEDGEVNNVQEWIKYQNYLRKF